MMKKNVVRSALAVGVVALFGSGIVATGCDSSSLSLDLSGIISGQSGASCSNETPDAGGDAGGCNSGFLCFNTYCVQEGAMRISLTFSVDSDFDLHVQPPNGAKEIYFSNRESGNGTLDVDQCVSTCGGGSHVENVFFTTAAAEGEYKFFVQNYSARAGGDFTIEVAANGQKKEFKGSVPDTSKANSETFTYSYPPPALPDAGSGDDAAADAGATDQ